MRGPAQQMENVFRVFFFYDETPGLISIFNGAARLLSITLFSLLRMQGHYRRYGSQRTSPH